MTALERRYRQLLAAYPSAHRQTYGEEMVAVLMDSAHPDQKRPSPRDTGLLLGHAFVARLRELRTPDPAGSRFSPDTTRAAAIFTMAGTAALTALHAYWLTATAATTGSIAQWAHWTPTNHTLLTVGWGLTLIALLLRRPGVAAALAVACGATELVDSGRLYDGLSYPGAISAARLLALTGVTLIVGAALVGRRERLQMRPSLVGVLITATALALSGLRHGSNGTYAQAFGHWFTLSTLLAVGALLLSCAWILDGVTAPVRHRLLVLMVPVPVQALVLMLGYDVWGWTPQRGRLVLLSLVGLVAFTVAVLALRGVERLPRPVTPDQRQPPESVAR